MYLELTRFRGTPHFLKERYRGVRDNNAFGSTLRGFDLDRDGRVDLDDYFLFANAFQTGQWQPEN